MRLLTPLRVTVLFMLLAGSLLAAPKVKFSVEAGGSQNALYNSRPSFWMGSSVVDYIGETDPELGYYFGLSSDLLFTSKAGIQAKIGYAFLQSYQKNDTSKYLYSFPAVSVALLGTYSLGHNFTAKLGPQCYLLTENLYYENNKNKNDSGHLSYTNHTIWGITGSLSYTYKQWCVDGVLRFL